MVTWLQAGSATDVGLVRANNQDNLLVADSLYAVADGMGGHAAGEVASEAAVRALGVAWHACVDPTPGALAEAARAANRAVWEKAQGDGGLRGMGTTLVAVALIGEHLAVINVGDSRVYRLHDGDLSQVTTDHSLVAELVAEGQIHSDEAEFHPQRHVLTRALGVDADVGVDLHTLDARPGDRLLLCSDGLSREVSDSQVAATLRRVEDPAAAARELVSEAKAQGGNDNITVVVVDVVTGDVRPVDESMAADNDGRDDTRALAAGPEPVGSDPTVAIATATAGTAGVTAAGRTAAGETAGGAGDVVGTAGALQGSRRQRHRARRAAEGPRARPVTVRVVAFIVLLLVVLAAGAAAVGFYARGSYYVGVADNQLVIYQGRPGGVLWFQPTVAEHTGVTTGVVLGGNLPALHAGVEESSLGSARAYVTNLRRAYQAAQRANHAGGTP